MAQPQLGVRSFPQNASSLFQLNYVHHVAFQEVDRILLRLGQRVGIALGFYTLA